MYFDAVHIAESRFYIWFYKTNNDEKMMATISRNEQEIMLLDD